MLRFPRETHASPDAHEGARLADDARPGPTARLEADASQRTAACDLGLCPLGAGGPGAILALRALSVSHRTAPIEALEPLALGPERRPDLSDRLSAAGLEHFILMTCNRAEIYWISRAAGDDAFVESEWLEAAGVRHFPALRLQALDVARHLFRIGSGLESMVLGEPEVLGQLRDALDEAVATERAGGLLSGLVTAAVRCGGRARAETSIGAGALSVASLAAQWLLAELIHPAARRVMVLGTGATGRAAARHLRAEGVSRIVMVNRTPSRARDAAGELGCEWAPLESLTAQLRAVDAVVASVAAPHALLTSRVIEAALRGRERPLAIVDVSMPRAADPVLRTCPGVALRDLSDLERAAADNRSRREREVPRVEALIERELRAFTTWARQQSLRPLMNAMRRRAERICRAELERAAAAGPLEGGRLDAATRRIVDLMLAAHAAVLQRGADAGISEDAS